MRHDLQSFRNTLLGLIGDALDFAERSRVDAASLRPNQRHSIYVAIDRLREARRGAESIVVGTSRPSSLSSVGIMTLGPGNSDSEYDASQSELETSYTPDTTEDEQAENDTAMSQGSDAFAPCADNHENRLSPVAEEGESSASAGPSQSTETHQEPSLAPSRGRKRELDDQGDDVEDSDSEMGEGGHEDESDDAVAKRRKT